MKHEEILLYVISLMRIFPLEFNEKMKSKAGTTGILGGVDILLTLNTRVCHRPCWPSPYGLECFHLGQLQSHDTPTSDLGMSDYASADICAHTAVLRPAALRLGVPFVADVLPFVPFVNRKTRYSW